MLDIHRDDRAAHQALAAMVREPSLYDESLRLLRKRGFAIPEEKCERDWSEPYEPDVRVEEAWLGVYRDPEAHWDLYELAEKLVDLEYRFQQWRFVHMKTVERIIGDKPGTGGTAGVPYLVKVINRQFFPELLKLRTML
jgi:tryptophan 2,3-dioxygenase